MSRSYAPLSSAPEQTLAPEAAPAANTGPADTMLQWATGLAGQGLALATQSNMGNLFALAQMARNRGARAAEAQFDGLQAMAPDQRAAALGELDDAAFDALMDDLPDSRQRELGDVFNAVSDPSRKLAVWERWQTAEQGALADEDLREANLAEVADEAETMRAEIAAGRATAADVHALATRKTQERSIEARYCVKLTNNLAPSWWDELMGVEADEQRTVWSETELDRVELALGRVREAGLPQGSAEIKRVSGDASLATGNTAAGENGEILVDNTSYVAADVAHGVGRQMAQANPDLQAAFATQAGWGGLKASEMTNQVLASFVQSQRGDPAASRANPAREPVTGRVYIPDPADPEGVLYLDEGRIPASTSEDPRSRGSWAGALASPEEHFAETVEHMVLDPEAARRDMVTGPREANLALWNAHQTSIQDRDRICATSTDSATLEEAADRTEQTRAEFDASRDDMAALDAMFEMIWQRALGWGAPEETASNGG